MENYKEITELENIETLAEPQLALWQTETLATKNELQVINLPQKNTQNYQKLNLESRRYIGNKNKLSSWIFDIILKETKNCKTFFDVFSGTGTIAKQAFQYYENVVINDILFSNEVIYKAFFEKSEWNKTKIEKLINFYNLLNNNELEENYFSINFGNKFFDNENAKIIGFIREDIEKRKSSPLTELSYHPEGGTLETLNEKEYCILLATLIYNIDKIANTVGHFDAYIKKPIRSQKLYLRLIETIDFQGVSIFRENANQLVRTIKTDIAYIDPPYNSRQYSRFYHIYENLVKWEKPELFGVALKPATENMSAYCTVQAKNAFADLVQNIDAKYLVVSYNNTYQSKSNSSENKIKLAEIEYILQRKGETKVFESSHKFFNAGKTDFNNHKEMLFVTKVEKNT
jgi:adenine-specific DNA-methyltransferase